MQRITFWIKQESSFLMDRASKKPEAPSVPEISEAYSYGNKRRAGDRSFGFPEDCGEISGGNADIISDESGILEEKLP